MFKKKDPPIPDADGKAYEHIYMEFKVGHRDIRIRDPPVAKAIGKLILYAVSGYYAVYNVDVADKIQKLTEALLWILH